MIFNLDCPVCYREIKQLEFLCKDFFCPHCQSLLTMAHDYSGEDYDLSVWLEKTSNE